MSSDDPIIVAFDLYGTLLSTESIARELGQHFGREKGQTLAATWRRYQLEYTWRLNSMERYETFSDITRKSLTHTLAEDGLALEDDEVEALMKAYDSLSMYADVAPALEELAKNAGITAVVFSNGTDAMVRNSVVSSRDLGPYAGLFRQIVTVEEVKCFKPAPKVYYHLAKKVGKGKGEEDMGKMWLVSGNPFDVVGCRAVGMNAAWVDRSGGGWTDGLVGGNVGRPTVVVKGLGEVAEAVRKHADSIKRG